MALSVVIVPTIVVGTCIIAQVVARRAAASQVASRTAGSVKTTRDTTILPAVPFPPLIDDIDIDLPFAEKVDIQFSDEVKNSVRAKVLADIAEYQNESCDCPPTRLKSTNISVLAQAHRVERF